MAKDKVGFAKLASQNKKDGGQKAVTKPPKLGELKCPTCGKANCVC